MYTFFVILIVLAALLMIGIVLIQESKGGGLSSNFSSSNQIMGVRKTTDFIEKATWGLAAAMVVLSVVCAYVLRVFLRTLLPNSSRQIQIPFPVLVQVRVVTRRQLLQKTLLQLRKLPLLPQLLLNKKLSFQAKKLRQLFGYLK